MTAYDLPVHVIAIALLGCIACAPGLVVAQDPGGLVSGSVTIFDRSGAKIRDHSGVVVFIDGLEDLNATTDHPPPKISHTGMRFSPRTLPIVKSQSVDFFNDDEIFHNVFSLSKSKVFDLGIYAEGSSKILRFDQPGLVKIYCNLHPNMIGNILILNNKYFASTDAAGNFQIANVPAGDFLLRVWHEYAEMLSHPITVSGHTVIGDSISITQSKVLIPHRNKFGKPYRKKY